MDSSEIRAKALINKFEKYRSRLVAGGMMYSVAYNVSVPTLMYFVVKHFVKGRYTSIVDPTCGTSNRQFGTIKPVLDYWGIEYRPCDKDPGNWACREGYKPCTCNVFEPETLPEGDVFIYDPPYMPGAKGDKRARDYNISVARPIDDIKKYYSRDIFEGFRRRGGKLVIVKGTDFFYPPVSNNIYLFLRDILEPPAGWRIVGVIIYRFFRGGMQLIGARILRSAEKRGMDLRRPLNTHTYYVILSPPS